MQASSAHSMPHTARRTSSVAGSGPIDVESSFRCTNSARMIYIHTYIHIYTHVGSVAANPDNLESNKEAGGEHKVLRAQAGIVQVERVCPLPPLGGSMRVA